MRAEYQLLKTEGVINIIKLNWKVRLKSKEWWMGVISAVVMAVFAILNICRVEISLTAEQVMNVAMLVLMIPVSIGIISDPTTQGVSDSNEALTYEAPKSSAAKDGE